MHNKCFLNCPSEMFRGFSTVFPYSLTCLSPAPAWLTSTSPPRSQQGWLCPPPTEQSGLALWSPAPCSCFLWALTVYGNDVFIKPGFPLSRDRRRHWPCVFSLSPVSSAAFATHLMFSENLLKERMSERMNKRVSEGMNA